MAMGWYCTTLTLLAGAGLAHSAALSAPTTQIVDLEYAIHQGTLGVCKTSSNGTLKAPTSRLTTLRRVQDPTTTSRTYGMARQRPVRTASVRQNCQPALIDD
jgi:hypothetical protein